MASQVTERFAFEHKSGTYGSYLGDGVSQGLYFLDVFLRDMGDQSAPAWRGRMTYYNDLDSRIMERIRTENFAQISAARNGWKPPQP